MSFTQSIAHVLRHYATFSGRARRSEYWWWTLFNILVSILTTGLDYLLFGDRGLNGKFSPVSWVATAALLIPGITVAARRLHDIGRSGWWQLIGAIPIIGWIVLLVWTVRDGDSGLNRFGDDPKSASLDALHGPTSGRHI